MSTDLAKREDFTLPTIEVVSKDLAAIRAFQGLIQDQLKDGHDYGAIPGTGGKATLLKPGAEKITKLLGLAEQYDIESSIEDWDKPLFRYLIRCRLVSMRTGQEVTQGFGECNSMEAKYRWRNQARVCPQCQAEAIIKGKKEYGGGWLCYKAKGGCGAKWADGAEIIEDQVVGRIPNDDIYSQVNTILKMAKKRALVDAALSVGRLSDLFTQDMEDLAGEPASEEMPAPPRSAARQQPRSGGVPQKEETIADVGTLLNRAMALVDGNGQRRYPNGEAVRVALGVDSGAKGNMQILSMYKSYDAAYETLKQARAVPVPSAEAPTPTTLRGTKATLAPPGASPEASQEPGEEGPPFG